MIIRALVLVLAAVLMVACSPSDAAITGVVKSKLATDSKAEATAIDVDTEDGVVTLKGTTHDPEAKEQALKLARETRGVDEVVDMISVRREGGSGDAPSPERTPGERLDDAGITAAVKARLIADPEIKGLDIDVDTRKGVVYLTGTVETPRQKEHAVELARGTKHVVEVQVDLVVEQET